MEDRLGKILCDNNVLMNDVCAAIENLAGRVGCFERMVLYDQSLINKVEEMSDKLSQMYQSCLNNFNALNSMMLEFKGCIAMARGALNSSRVDK